MNYLVAILLISVFQFSMAETGRFQIIARRGQEDANVRFIRKAQKPDCTQKMNVTIFEHWPVAFKAIITVIAPSDTKQWKIHLMFSKTVTLLQVPKATYSRVNKNYFILTKAPWASGNLKQGDKLQIEFIAYVKGQLPRITALFSWKGTCIFTPQPTTDYNYFDTVYSNIFNWSTINTNIFH